MTKNKSLRVGIVVPHIFMQDALLYDVIFSPGHLALDLAEGLAERGVEVTLYSPGPVTTNVSNQTADLSYFESELAGRGYGYLELLKKHPGTFITLARQVQAELIASAYADANADKLDLVHIYTNEEELALPFAPFCNKPVVFTHHDPFNFLIKYKNVMPKYADRNWISISMAQRNGMPKEMDWVGNVYHGLAPDRITPLPNPAGNYVAYFGRIVEQKGVHLAINAILGYNSRHANDPLQLRIAGKHYAETSNDTYWHTQIEPHIDGKIITYEGFLRDDATKQDFLGNALALMVPSIFDEPFGMVMIEALACGTPIVGLDSGAISEVVKDGQTGFVIPKSFTTKNALDATGLPTALAAALENIGSISRQACRADFEQRFTLQAMCDGHITVYKQLTGS